MKRLHVVICLLVLCASLPATPTFGQTCTIGGHNETSENFAPGGWGITPPTLGSGPAGLPVPHLVISEVAPRGFGNGVASDSSEYVEIYNPTARPVHLDDKYLSDDIGYYRIVNGPYPAANNTDWAGRFPAGLTLDPGRTLIVCVTKAGFAASGASAPLAQYVLEMRDSNANPTDDMTILTTVTSIPLIGGMMTNPSATNGEWIVLYCWNGVSDLVCDLDYASWGATSATNPKMNKSGISLDGPDAGAVPSAYNADTAPAGQSNLGAGTALTKPNTYQRVGGGEAAEVNVGGNGCLGRVQPTVINWLPVAGTDHIRFHVRWTNMDEDSPSSQVSGQMLSQDFGVFQPDFGSIGSFNVPPLQPSSFFDVFFEVPLSSLPPAPQKILPGGGPIAPPGLLADSGPATLSDCPPDTNWAGNVDIWWLGPGYDGMVNKHYADLLTCAGGPPSYIHFRGSNCPSPMPWTISGLAPGFSATLVNEDFTPAPNPVPVGWTGWICVSAAAGVPSGTSSCFGVTFTCDDESSTIDICSTACDWSNPQPPVLSVIDWVNVGSLVKFHLGWHNENTTTASLPVSGDLRSQPFGVFQPIFGHIGHFDVPPLPPNSFFDVFT
ncbi:MAG TPA: lamin tail domain-containing protein, partial [Candidatus Eisenbacteria bacterium]